MSHLYPVFLVVKFLTTPPDLIPRQQSCPPLDPILVDGEEYEVEAVINSCMFQGQLQYLIQSKSYSYKHNSWEDAMYGGTLSKASCGVLLHPSQGPTPSTQSHFDYISFQPSLDHCAKSSLPRGGVM